MNWFVNRGRLVAAGVVLTGVLGFGAVTALPGAASSTGLTYTVTSGPQKVGQLDAAPAGASRGRLSLGDQLTLSGPITRNGGIKGTGTLLFTVSDTRPVSASQAHGYASGVYHFANGDMYLEAYSSFSNSAVIHGAVVGGTGAYAGARGVFTGRGSRTTINLLP